MYIFIILAYTFISQIHISIIQNFYMEIFFGIIYFTFQETFFFFFMKWLSLFFKIFPYNLIIDLFARVIITEMCNDYIKLNNFIDIL